MGRGLGVAVAVLFCTIFINTVCQGGGVPEIFDERIAVELDPPSHLLTGVSTVAVGPHSGGKMEFDLSAAATPFVPSSMIRCRNGSLRWKIPRTA